LNLPEERVDDGEGGAKFRDLDELSDDDELEMEISSASDTEGPSRKRARTDGTTEEADSAPKWSNPDPYTALPCPDETTRKKRDVVKLIRKARLEALAKPDGPPEAEDFLSFDTEAEEEDDEEVEEIPHPPAGPPPPLPPSAPAAFAHKHPDDRGKQNGLPAPDRSGPLGSRKRTADDEIKPPDYGQLKKVSMKPPKGSITATWLPKKNEDPCPWQTRDHTSTHTMAFRCVRPLEPCLY
jgi:non-canonical poly(A) RNA polymerase PAPD5/7